MTKGRRELIQYVASFYAKEYIEDGKLERGLYSNFFDDKLNENMIRESIEELYSIAKKNKIIFVHSLFLWSEYLHKLLNEDGESEIRELIRDYMLVKYGFEERSKTEFGRFFEENNII